MGYTAYHYMISHGQESCVRAWLNDLPFYRYYEPLAVNRTGPAIHLLVPGVNTFAIEIDRAPVGTQTFCNLLIDLDTKNPAFSFVWPRETSALPTPWDTPFRFEARFTPPGELFTPVWLDSPAVDVPCDGTPDLREALRRVHAAIEARDVDAYCAAFSLKASETERAYPGWEGTTEADMRSSMTGFFREDLRVRPLDMDNIHFESRAQGRVVHARHLGGGNVIDAISMDRSPDGFGARVTMDLTFTRHRGEWKIIL